MPAAGTSWPGCAGAGWNSERDRRKGKPLHAPPTLPGQVCARNAAVRRPSRRLSGLRPASSSSRVTPTSMAAIGAAHTWRSTSGAKAGAPVPRLRRARGGASRRGDGDAASRPWRRTRVPRAYVYSFPRTRSHPRARCTGRRRRSIVMHQRRPRRRAGPRCARRYLPTRGKHARTRSARRSRRSAAWQDRRAVWRSAGRAPPLGRHLVGQFVAPTRPHRDHGPGQRGGGGSPDVDTVIEIGRTG